MTKPERNGIDGKTVE